MLLTGAQQAATLSVVVRPKAAGATDLPVQVIEPGAGLLHVRTCQPDHWINLHHQVPSQARLPGEAGDGIRVVFEPHKGRLPDPRRHVAPLPTAQRRPAAGPPAPPDPDKPKR